jgi:hypothetical protein
MRDGFAIPRGDRPPVAALAHDPAGVVRVAAAAEQSRWDRGGSKADPNRGAAF